MFTKTKSSGLGILRRHTLKTSVLAIACSVGICTSILYTYDRKSWDTARSGVDQYLHEFPHPFGIGVPVVIQDGPTIPLHGTDYEEYCTAADYANGRWIHRADPPISLKEIQTLYSTTVSPPHLLNPVTPDERYLMLRIELALNVIRHRSPFRRKAKSQSMTRTTSLGFSTIPDGNGSLGLTAGDTSSAWRRLSCGCYAQELV